MLPDGPQAAGIAREHVRRQLCAWHLEDLAKTTIVSPLTGTVSKTFTDRLKDLLKTVGGKVLLGSIVLLALGGGVLWWLFSKRQKMLAVMTTAIEHLGTEQLKQNIQQQATASNVEGSLHRYLKRRGMS